MFDQTSRYTTCEDARITQEDGSTVLYKRRRFLPQGNNMSLLSEVTVMAGDRLDVMAARLIGHPEQYWRLCDANNAMHPLEMTSEPGKALRIATPW